MWLYITLRNNGTTAGTCYFLIRRNDTGEVIYNGNFSLNVNGSISIDHIISFVMPSGSLSLYFEIGHS